MSPPSVQLSLAPIQPSFNSLLSVGRMRRLEQAAQHVEAGAADLVAVAVRVVAVVAPDEVAEHVDRIVEAVGAGGAGRPAVRRWSRIGRSSRPPRSRRAAGNRRRPWSRTRPRRRSRPSRRCWRPARACTSTSCSSSGSIQNMLCVPWPERWKSCRAPSTMTATRPKSCRPRMLTLDAGALGVGLHGDARHAEEDVGRRRRHAPVELLLVDMADRGQRLDRRLAGAADHRDLVEQRGAGLLARSAALAAWSAAVASRPVAPAACRIQSPSSRRRTAALPSPSIDRHRLAAIANTRRIASRIPSTNRQPHSPNSKSCFDAGWLVACWHFHCPRRLKC